MTRWLATLVLGTSLLAGPVGAQVFKPKGGSSTSSSGSSKSSTGKSGSTSAKKASAGSAKKTTGSSRRGKKKSSAASKGRPSDLTPDDAPKVDPDYVKITDDDE